MRSSQAPLASQNSYWACVMGGGGRLPVPGRTREQKRVECVHPLCRVGLWPGRQQGGGLRNSWMECQGQAWCWPWGWKPEIRHLSLECQAPSVRPPDLPMPCPAALSSRLFLLYLYSPSFVSGTQPSPTCLLGPALRPLYLPGMRLPPIISSTVGVRHALRGGAVLSGKDRWCSGSDRLPGASMRTALGLVPPPHHPM